MYIWYGDYILTGIVKINYNQTLIFESASLLFALIICYCFKWHYNETVLKLYKQKETKKKKEQNKHDDDD